MLLFDGAFEKLLYFETGHARCRVVVQFGDVLGTAVWIEKFARIEKG
jgi:hypothetical protein